MWPGQYSLPQRSSNQTTQHVGSSETQVCRRHGAFSATKHHIFGCLVFSILSCRYLTFCTSILKIKASVGTDEDAGESNPEANELELSRVSKMQLILADPGQCIL